MLLVVIFVVLLVGLAIYVAVQKAKAVEAARLAYLQSLADLRQAPANADLKQKTLALGRQYSFATRDNKGTTVFDEVALMNDLNAACAAANVRPVVETVRSTASLASPSPEVRLQTLVSLRDKGLIEVDEYQRRRQEILNSL